MDLHRLGWREHFAAQCGQEDVGLLPARVARQSGEEYRLFCAEGEIRGVAAGKLHFASSRRAELPTVGDWVLAERVPEDPSRVVIRRVLGRYSAFSRKEAGEKTGEQVLAANVDTIFITAGLDGNFNPRRIERYLLLARTSGAHPVVLLTKSDLCADVAQAVSAVRRVAPEVTIHAISAATGDGMEALDAYFQEGETVSLLGSSGVGKSTIVNRLLGDARFATTEVRKDSKGRHTTTWRELVLLPSGALVIDTPGMRELQLWGDEETLAQGYEDIERIAERCRYRDCAHLDEPGCAVKQAIADGTLDEERLHAYLRFRSEIARLAKQQEKQERAARKADGRRIPRQGRRGQRDPAGDDG